MNGSAREEIGLGSLLAVVYRQRFFIAYGVLAVCVVTAVAALLWPRTYQASAGILVSPPSYKKTMLLISEPYSVVTYEKLADNPNLKMAVVEHLKQLRAALEKGESLPPLIRETGGDSSTPPLTFTREAGGDSAWQLSPEEQQGILALSDKWLNDLGTVTIGDWMEVQTYIEEETNLGVKYASLLTLVARAPNPGAAAALANLWATALLQRDRETTVGEAARNIASTVGSASRVQSLMDQIAKRRELTPTLALGEKYLNELETVNATLYGRTETRTMADARGGETETAQSLADTGLYGQYQRAEQRVQAREREIAQLSALVAQQEEEGRWIGEPGVIQDPAREQAALATRRADLEAALARSAEQIARLSAEQIALASAEKAAFDAYLKLHIEQIRPLREENRPIPPDLEVHALASLHDEKKKAREAKDAELAAARAEETQLRNSLLATQARAAALVVLAARRNRLPGEAAGEAALAELRQRYQAHQAALTRAQTDLLAAQAERDSLARRIRELEARRDELQPEVNAYLVERDNLERKLKLQSAFFENEANLARQVEAHNEELLETPNLQLAGAALPPNKRISPKRTRMVLLGAFGALVVFTLLAFARESLEEVKREEDRKL